MLKKKLTPYLPFLILLFAGILIRIIYLSYTDYQTRTHDVVGGHLSYIEFIAKEHKLPPPTFCWECWQPPFYYVTASFIFNAAILIHVNPYVSLQLFSLLLYATFLWYGYLFFISALHNKRAQYLAALLLTFWPTSIMHSIRIGNDTPYYLFFGVSLYYLSKWIKTEKYQYLIAGALSCFFCIITKQNGIVPYSILISIFCFELITNAKTRTNLLKQSVPLALILVLGFVIGFSNVIFHKMKMIASIDSLHSGLIVGKSLSHFVLFDIKTYLTKPFLSVWVDQGELTGGRQYFWNYLFKSSLFGEFSYIHPVQIALSYMTSILLLPIAYSQLLIVRFLKRPFSLLRLFMFLSLLIPLAALLSYRIIYPHGPNGDFRFILPILIPVCTFISLIVQYIEAKKLFLLYYLILSIVILFVVATILLYITPLFPTLIMF